MLGDRGPESQAQRQPSTAMDRWLACFPNSRPSTPARRRCELHTSRLRQYGAHSPSKFTLSLWPQLLTTLIPLLTSWEEGVEK